MQLTINVTCGCLYSIWQAVYSYLDRLLSRVIRGNLVTMNNNVVQTCQFVSMINYNQATQNRAVKPKKIKRKCHLLKIDELNSL